MTSPTTKMITIDGVEVAFQPGDTIMNAAERAGITDIPRFCYHEALPIAGTCRMCSVEVEKAPKTMTACSTPATEGMVVKTKTDKIKKLRTAVMEFLLTNHPLDCPVCDQAGECQLQEYDYAYGPGTSRFNVTDGKRTFPNASTKKLSTHITLNMNRCIHCERCVRFEESVTNTSDLVMVNRSWEKELVLTDEKKGLTSDYQGNLADLCPVGALTNNDFRFKKRVWFLKKAPSICDGCSKGCNIEVHSEENQIYRLTPRFNREVNGHFICDEGRLSYKLATRSNRVTVPVSYKNGELLANPWEKALSELKLLDNPIAIIGTDCTTEEAALIKSRYSRSFYYNGINGDDRKLDHLLRMHDKSPNTNGIAALGISKLNENHLTSAEKVIYFRQGRAPIPTTLKNAAAVYLVGVFTIEDIEKLSGVNIKALLPSLLNFEKSGSYTNCDGITQSFTKSVAHTGNSLALKKILE